MNTQRDSIWSSMLTADLNVRYWRRVTHRYVVVDRASRLALFASSSSAVLSLLQAHIGFQVGTTVVSAVLAGALPVLNYTAQIETTSTLCGKWTQLGIEYERLWSRVETSPLSDTTEQLRLLNERTIEINETEAKLPLNKRLLQECQQEVLRAWGLSQ